MKEGFEVLLEITARMSANLDQQQATIDFVRETFKNVDVPEVEAELIVAQYEVDSARQLIENARKIAVKSQ